MPLSRKQGPTIFEDAAGMPEIDTLLPAFFTGAAARYGADAAARMAADFISRRVARFFGLAKKGALHRHGRHIAVLQPGRERARLLDAQLRQARRMTARLLRLRPVATYVCGTLAWTVGRDGPSGPRPLLVARARSLP